MSAVIIARMEKSVAGNQIRRMTCENNQAHRDVIKLIHLRSALIEASMHLSFNSTRSKDNDMQKIKVLQRYLRVRSDAWDVA